MRVIDKFLNGTPPPLLFHYTDATGLLGIFDKREVWASSAYHLNDAQEYRYAINLICERLDLRIKAGGEHAATYTLLAETFTGMPESLQAFIASFTEDGDLLSQWLAYSGSVNGYAIGVSPDHFIPAHADGFRLVRCVYTKVEQVELADAVIDLLRDDMDFNTGSVGEQERVAVLVAAAMMKHEGFREEKEWRLVKTDWAFSPINGIDFRKGRNGLVPYLKSPLQSEENQLVPKAIHIGPNQDMDAAVSAMQTFLSSRGLNNLFMSKVPVIASKTPYRP